MKSQEPQEKKFRELSDQELEKVNGGGYMAILTPFCDVTKCIELGKETDPETCQCI